MFISQYLIHPLSGQYNGSKYHSASLIVDNGKWVASFGYGLQYAMNFTTYVPPWYSYSNPSYVPNQNFYDVYLKTTGTSGTAQIALQSAGYNGSWGGAAASVTTNSVAASAVSGVYVTTFPMNTTLSSGLLINQIIRNNIAGDINAAIEAEGAVFRFMSNPLLCKSGVWLPASSMFLSSQTASGVYISWNTYNDSDLYSIYFNSNNDSYVDFRLTLPYDYSGNLTLVVPWISQRVSGFYNLTSYVESYGEQVSGGVLDYNSFLTLGYAATWSVYGTGSQIGTSVISFVRLYFNETFNAGDDVVIRLHRRPSSSSEPPCWLPGAFIEYDSDPRFSQAIPLTPSLSASGALSNLIYEYGRYKAVLQPSGSVTFNMPLSSAVKDQCSFIVRYKSSSFASTGTMVQFSAACASGSADPVLVAGTPFLLPFLGPETLGQATDDSFYQSLVGGTILDLKLSALSCDGPTDILDVLLQARLL